MFEKENPTETKFNTMLDAYWWALITMTTVSTVSVGISNGHLFNAHSGTTTIPHGTVNVLIPRGIGPIHMGILVTVEVYIPRGIGGIGVGLMPRCIGPDIS